MNKRYITNIRVNNLYHLHDFSISIEDDANPHLFITGKNGSGKTILLKAVSEFLDLVVKDKRLDHMSYRKRLSYYQEQEKSAISDDKERLSIHENLIFYQNKVAKFFGKVEISFSDIAQMVEKYGNGEFVIAFYEATRKVQMTKVDVIKKPNIDNTKNSTSQFLYYLTDLKIQEALARNEGKEKDADNIKDWFCGFEMLLRRIFCDNELKLEFNYTNYDFAIIASGGKQFDFNQMSDGYAAILDIVVDLIMRMQPKDSLTRAYEREGIVLIDEVETHLHLQLQKDVMPLLTRIFPNIQFVITTHSPFVLNSINNSVAYDLEQHKPIADLEQYSYESLVEGYFGVNTESGYMDYQLDEFENLLKRQEISKADTLRLSDLIRDFDKISEPVAPDIIGRYNSLKIKYSGILKNAGLL